ncbi:MAG TPA: hypothetical protein VKG45_09945 [Actinomycetes bacterium]|nr:hypothetical protein [Actinomycetes bacterium]
MARYLVVAHQTAASPELIRRARELAAEDPAAEFVLLVPATPATHLLGGWEEGEVREIAQRRAREASAALAAAGVNLTGARIGDASPMQAVEDTLREDPPFDVIVVSTFPPGISRWLRADLPGKLRRRCLQPVEHVVAAPASSPTST